MKAKLADPPLQEAMKTSQRSGRQEVDKAS